MRVRKKSNNIKLPLLLRKLALAVQGGQENKNFPLLFLSYPALLLWSGEGMRQVSISLSCIPTTFSGFCNPKHYLMQLLTCIKQQSPMLSLFLSLPDWLETRGEKKRLGSKVDRFMQVKTKATLVVSPKVDFVPKTRLQVKGGGLKLKLYFLNTLRWVRVYPLIIIGLFIIGILLFTVVAPLPHFIDLQGCGGGWYFCKSHRYLFDVAHMFATELGSLKKTFDFIITMTMAEGCIDIEIHNYIYI